MSTTLEALEAQSKVVEVRGDPALVAATLDSLAAYEQAATLEATITACERSERLCGAHADHHDHCRLHAAVALDTIAACEALLARLPRA